MKFTYESYMDMINYLKHKGYKFVNYDMWNKYKKTVILRHDVDYSLQKAAMFSNIEKSLGIQSTYFILLSTEFYNVHSKKSRKYIEDIIINGGKIGLHFDEMQYDIKTEKELKEYLQMEANILSDIVGVNIDAVSMHRPSEKFLSGDMEFDNIINSYSKTYFKDMKYLSDSRRYWREDIDMIIKRDIYQKLHILVHPFWYFANSEKDLKQTLRESILDASLVYYDNLSENFKNLGDEISRDEIERI